MGWKQEVEEGVDISSDTGANSRRALGVNGGKSLQWGSQKLLEESNNTYGLETRCSSTNFISDCGKQSMTK